MTIRKTGAIAVVAMAVFVARDGVAVGQSAAGFGGSWVRVDQPGRDGRPLPKLLLQVMVDGATLTVERRVDAGQPGPSTRYRLELPAASLGAAADPRVLTFRVDGPDRLEVHDFIPSPGRGAVVTGLWELREGGRALQIRRTFRFLDDVPTKLEDEVYTFQRVGP